MADRAKALKRKAAPRRVYVLLTAGGVPMEFSTKAKALRDFANSTPGFLGYEIRTYVLESSIRPGGR